MLPKLQYVNILVISIGIELVGFIFYYQSLISNLIKKANTRGKYDKICLCLRACADLGTMPIYFMVGTTMSNEWIYGEYKGTVDIIETGDDGPWALLDAEKINDPDNAPLVQVRITDELYNQLNEDTEVTFTLTSITDSGEECDVIYQDEVDEINDVAIIDLKVISHAVSS